MGDRTGQQVGNYHLVRLLGRGGFAEVYLGEHRRLQTQAAIKVLLTSLAQGDEKDFLKEARIVANLAHPHIVRVLDFDIQDSTPFLVMSYAPNGNVRLRHPKGTALPLPTVVEYVKQVASALQYAHNERFIHRDIKPENILVGRHQELLLSDFGIALIAQSSRLQSIQEVAGTAAYMAPEQFQGKPRFASDQYALGVIVYEWLCGMRPFHGSFTEIASQHLFVPPPPLREKVPDLPPDVEQVVQTALAKDPAQRFGSVQAFATALEHSSHQRHVFPSAPLQNETAPERSSSPNNVSTSAGSDLLQASSAPEPQATGTITPLQQLSASSRLDERPASSNGSSPPEARPPVPMQSTNQIASPVPLISPAVLAGQVKRRVNRRVVIAGLATLVVAGGGVYWLNHPQHPSQVSSHISSEGTRLYTYKGHSATVDGIAWSPDSKRIASASYDGTVQVWNATDGSAPFTYQGHTGAVVGVTWSPDGKRIASAGVDGTVQVWNAIDGSASFTYKGHSGAVLSVEWSPDGKRIASAGFDETVQVWNAADGSAPFTYKGHYNQVDAVAWSPDGKRIASAGYDDTVQVWNATDGSASFTYTGHSSIVYGVAWSPDGKHIASAGGDQKVQVWNAADGSSLYIYKGHPNIVHGVAWSPDGRHIASASNDRTVQVWNATDGSSPYIYQGHLDGVNSVEWSPDGKLIASGGWDRMVQVWRAG